MCISNYVVVVVVVAVVAVAAVVVAVAVAVVVVVVVAVAVVTAVEAAAAGGGGVVVVAVVKKVPRCKSILARWMRKDQIPMRKDKQTYGKPSDSYEGRFENEWSKEV